MARRQTTASLPVKPFFLHMLPKMSSLFIYFFVVTVVHSLPPRSTAKSFAEVGLPNGAIDRNSNFVTNRSTTLDSFEFSPSAVELVTQSSNISDRTDHKLISSVTLVNDTHSQVINPSEVGSTVSPVTFGDVLLINATKEVVSPSPATNEEVLQSTATVREPFVSPTTNGEALLTADREGELSNGSTINREALLSTDKEREPSYISSNGKALHSTTGVREPSHNSTNIEAPLATAREIEPSLSPSTNKDALLINDTSLLSEDISHIVKFVREENHSNNDVSANNETKAFSTRPSTNDSLSFVSSQTEEHPPQMTKPHELEKRILALNETVEEGIKTKSKPTVIAKKCCENSEILLGTHCVAKTNPSPFDPLIGNKQDSDSIPHGFSWDTMMLTCPENFKYREISFPDTGVPLGANGVQSYLQWTDLSMRRQTSQYCIDQKQDGGYTALMCMADKEKICDKATCIKKCCGHGEVKSHSTCVSGSPNSNLTFYNLAGDVSDAPPDLQLLPLVPDCRYKATLKFEGSYHFLLNGKLYLTGSEQIIDNDMFCVDYYKESHEYIVIYCISQPSAVQDWKLKIAPIGMFISIVCLVLLILFHFFAKKLLNVQGYCFLSYSTSLLLAYIGFFVNFQYAKHMQYEHCVFNGLFSQFTLHAAFFWLSVMSFDIWKVIRSTVKCIPLTGILEKDMQKFLLYSAYAFGCPLIIVVVTFCMQSLSPEASAGLIVPGFGKESCWFADEKAQFLYFYLVIATLNTASLCMLGHVILLLSQAESGVSCILQKNKARKHLALFRQRLSIFAMMAICWFTEVLSLKIPPKEAWVVTDILNTLQGVIVFIIFMASKQKRQLVQAGMKKIFRRTLQKLNSIMTEGSDVADTPETSKDTTGSTEQSAKEMASIPAGTQHSGSNRNNPSLLEAQENSSAYGPSSGVVNAGYQHDEETTGVDGSNNMKEKDTNV
ncbi:probable G-protein coupled receptor Mth-like 1 isoform X1 [Palaemon carinicauda]|uniref:probable G-protein coupled receptor Mth-like 1 isoform X1 n=1 Tax=Palaemon carinicauda TaxID=392227 RepID=UPI0035B5B1D7